MTASLLAGPGGESTRPVARTRHADECRGASRVIQGWGEMFRLDGKRAIVTGAGSGIGQRTSGRWPEPATFEIRGTRDSPAQPALLRRNAGMSN